MAPRTKEQQIAYNLKRRQETAAKKAGALIGAGPAPAQTKSVPVVRRSGFDGPKSPTDGAIVTTPKRKVGKDTFVSKKTGKTYFTKAKVVERAVREGKRAATKPKLLDAKIGLVVMASMVKPLPPKAIYVPKDKTVLSHAANLAASGHRVMVQTKGLGGGGGGGRSEPKPHAPKARDPWVTNSRIPNATMAMAYQRNGAPGGGMQRGKNFQATVTFTPEQFAELRDKALFNQRSLAEQIRWSVIQTLKGDQ